MDVQWAGMDVHAEFGDSRSNGSRDIRVAHFMMDNERTTADAGSDIRQKRIA